jgi:hypothetical protein
MQCERDARGDDVTGGHPTVETKDGECREEIERVLLDCGSASGKVIDWPSA